MCNSLVLVPGTSDRAGSGAGLRESVSCSAGPTRLGAQECLSHVTGSSQIMGLSQWIYFTQCQEA